MTLPRHNRRVPAVALLGGALALVAMTTLAGAPFLEAASALAAVYAFGYLVGSLLVDRVDEGGLSLTVIRTVAGLLLTTIGFLLCLVLSVPWFVVPGGLVALAVGVRRRTAFAWPEPVIRFGWDGVAAAALTTVVVSPILISLAYMAPGSFPPVFYNIDTAYFMEKVHGLVTGNLYPPESLSNVGIRRTYHYGTQAMAALVTRASGLPPHQSTFLIVLPLLTAGVVAAAVAIARYVSPAVPRSVSVPLLLISTPAMSSSFWERYGPQLWTAITGGPSIDAIVGDLSLWGILSNEGQNVGGDFAILASVVSIAAAPSWGWRLPAFLIGSAILVKTPVGIALVAGFALTEAWRALVTRNLRPSPQALMAATVFVVTAVAFFVVGFESNFRVERSWFFHLLQIQGRGSLPGFLFDVLWLFVPALIVLSGGIKDPDGRSAPLLLMGLAPLAVVNLTRMDNVGPGGGGTGNDWFQIVHSVPFMLHAFALSLASRRWDRLGSARRAAYLVTTALMIGPVVLAGARYSLPFLANPENGNEFVDNRRLAEALSTIPTRGTILATNDLRYPAQNFARDYRQMQIPALFGHQAFAVNYAHEAVEERRELQVLLQQPEWNDAILEAARTHHWTHLLIRKDYAHPVPIPLEQLFENEIYAVFRFP